MNRFFLDEHNYHEIFEKDEQTNETFLKSNVPTRRNSVCIMVHSIVSIFKVGEQLLVGSKKQNLVLSGLEKKFETVIIISRAI